MDLLDVAHSAARAYLRAHPAYAYHADDVLSDACWGAARAAASHDPAKGAALNSRAYLRARGAILDGVRDRSPVGRHQYRRGVTLADLPVQRRTALSLDALAASGWCPLAPRDMEDAVADRDLIDRMLATCTERERIVLVATLLHGHTLADVADVLGISDSLACRIRRDAVARLRTQFAGVWLDAA